MPRPVLSLPPLMARIEPHFHDITSAREYTSAQSCIRVSQAIKKKENKKLSGGDRYTVSLR